MKKITFTLILTLFFFSCNDKKEVSDLQCSDYFMEMKDAFEKRTLYRSKDVFLKDINNEIIGNLYLSSLDLKSFAMNISLIKPICTDDNSKIIFLFDDESIVNCPLINSMNCDGNLLAYYIYHTDFNFKTLKGFRVKGLNDLTDFYLNPETSIEIKKASTCYFTIAFEKSKNK